MKIADPLIVYPFCKFEISIIVRVMLGYFFMKNTLLTRLFRLLVF
jgi:hypothetical protein